MSIVEDNLSRLCDLLTPSVWGMNLHVIKRNGDLLFEDLWFTAGHGLALTGYEAAERVYLADDRLMRRAREFRLAHPSNPKYTPNATNR